MFTQTRSSSARAVGWTTLLSAAPLPSQVFVTDLGNGDVRVFDPETGDGASR